MSALANIWAVITDIERQDDDTTRLTLADIGFGLDGSKFEITGVGGSTLYEGLQFTATRVDDDNVDIDWAEHSITAPPDTWTVGGMVRVYQTPVSCSGAMRISFNPHEITAITSATGNTGENGIDNVLSSDRDLVHTADGGTDHQIAPTVKVGSLVTSIALVDFRATTAAGGVDTDTQIRIRGGDTPVDVVYPAIADRYLSSEVPADGYPGIVDGHNINDPTPHFIAYIPAMVADGTEKIDIIDSNAGTTLEFSELLLSSYWQPGVSKNFIFGSQTKGSIKAVDTWRGNSLGRKREGLGRVRTATLEMMDESDCTYADLISKSDGTIICDSYPAETSKRWRTMVAGFLTGDIDIDELRPGGMWPISIIDTKLIEDI